MRRRIQCLAITLALLVGLTLPALAAEALTVTGENGVYTVRLDAGAENAGKAFSLRVTALGSDEKTLYLAQTAADGGGIVTFRDVRPKVAGSAEFLVAGGSLPAPVVETVTVPGTVVLGQVELHGKADCSGATVTFNSADTIYTVHPRYDGSYMTDALPEGTYSVVVSADNYHTVTSSILIMTGDDYVVPGTVTLFSGDVNKSGVTDEADLTALLVDFGKTQGLVYPGSDVNGDGYVNGADLSMVVESIDSRPDGSFSSDPVVTATWEGTGEEGVYVLTAETNGAAKRLEVMFSWDGALLERADHPGTIAFPPAAAAAFYNQTGREACYLAVSDGAGEERLSASLRLRLKEGKTEADLHKGSIRVETDPADDGFLSRILPASDRYGALVGQGGTVTRHYPDGGLGLTLTYPGSGVPMLAELVLRSADMLIIPAADDGSTYSALALTAVGIDTEGDEMPLDSSLAWSLLSAPAGVTLEGGELRAEKSAASGSAVVQAAYGGVTAEKTITVARDYPELTRIQLQRGGAVLGGIDRLTVPDSGSRDYPYAAALFDQYGAEMEPDPGASVTWTLAPESDKVTVLDGVVTVSSGADLTTAYTLTAGVEGLMGAVTIRLDGSGSAAPSGRGGVTVSGSGADITVKAEPVKGKDGSYTAELTARAAAEILKAAAGKTGSVVITVSAGAAGDKSTLILPGSVAAALAKTGQPLILALPAARVRLSATQMVGLSGSLSVSTQQTGERRTAIAVTAGGETVPGLTVFLPREKSAAGLTAMLVGEDGALTPVRKSAWLDGSMAAQITGSAVIELRDNGKAFSDMADNWAADSVAFVSARELFSGTGVSTFSPELGMTRGMLATVLYRLEGEPNTTGAGLRDVEPGAWYARGAAWCAERGIVSGKDGGLFDPGALVTREELALMLYRLASPGEQDPPIALHAFTDGDKVSPWAESAVRWAVSAGLLGGKEDGSLDPVGSATRAEVAAMLERFVKLECGEGGAR